MRLDTTRAQRELGWSPRYESFADGLRRSITLG
jgi:nucleoside-diphosphate-sugar epimerase